MIRFVSDLFKATFINTGDTPEDRLWHWFGVGTWSLVVGFPLCGVLCVALLIFGVVKTSAPIPAGSVRVDPNGTRWVYTCQTIYVQSGQVLVPTEDCNWIRQ